MRAALGRFGVPAVAAGLAAVLLTGLLVAALRTGTASAATVLQRGGGVVAQLSDGSFRPLVVGEEVPRGALVVAGRDGAVLRTRDRDTWLGGGSAVTVVDGARQELREGLVMVDARRGPALLLSTPAAEVTTPEGSVSRVEGGRLLRVGSYDGNPLSVEAAGRRATTPVARDYQVQVPEGSLPGRVTPLVLTPGDAYERALAPLLVAADEALGEVAVRLDDEGQPADVVRSVADTEVPVAAVPAGAPASERTLAYLLARAASADAVPGGLAARYATVRSLRADGGSWGVVADLVRADVSDVARLLDELLSPGQALLVADELDVATLLGQLGAATDADADAGAASAPGPAPASPAAPAPAPAPAPVPGPPAPPPAQPGPLPPPVSTDPETLVDVVVDTVVGLLPPLTATPAPSPSPSGGVLEPVLRPLLP